MRRSGLVGLEARLAALNSQATLARGYAIVRRTETGELVRSVA
jgi:exonuclease VII large subunit